MSGEFEDRYSVKGVARLNLAAAKAKIERGFPHLPKTEIVITEGPWADFADIDRLDKLTWGDLSTESVQAARTLYHMLATQYGEEMIIYQIAKHDAGITW